MRQKLLDRERENALRSLPVNNALVDFASNDYLGFARDGAIFDRAHQYLSDNNTKINGATGSRLICGNHPLYGIAESFMATFHQSESALIFNSGYDANLGFFSSVPQRNDIILYDEHCHASIRDGIRLGPAKAYKFAHNDFEDLEKLILKNLPSPASQQPSTLYIATESVFSMDGDSPDFENLIRISEKYGCLIVADEAHALGVFGENGQGLLQSLNLHDKIFARIVTFGKALGCHGAVILGSTELRDFLVNFARSFIYTTGLPPHSIATVLMAYRQLAIEKKALETLKENIRSFNRQITQLGLKPLFIYSKSAIQCAIIPGNEKVKTIAGQLQRQGFDVKPILSPTVPHGQERLRICLHSYNSEGQIDELLRLLSTFVF